MGQAHTAPLGRPRPGPPGPEDTPGPTWEGAACSCGCPAPPPHHWSARCLLPPPDTGLPREQCEKQRGPQRPEPQPRGGSVLTALGSGLSRPWEGGWAPPTSSTQPPAPRALLSSGPRGCSLPNSRSCGSPGTKAGGQVSSLPGQHTASARPRHSPGAPRTLQFPCICAPPPSSSPQGRQDKVGFCQLIPSSHRANVAPSPALQKARPSTSAPRKGAYAHPVPVRLGEPLRNRATCVSAHRPPHPAPHRAGQETGSFWPGMVLTHPGPAPSAPSAPSALPRACPPEHKPLSSLPRPQLSGRHGGHRDRHNTT